MWSLEFFQNGKTIRRKKKKIINSQQIFKLIQKQLKEQWQHSISPMIRYNSFSMNPNNAEVSEFSSEQPGGCYVAQK